MPENRKNQELLQGKKQEKLRMTPKPDTTQLTLVQETLSIPGVQINLRGMDIDAKIGDRALLSIGSRLGAVGGVMSWAWADYMLALYRRYCTPADPKDGDDEGDDTWLATYCDEHAIDAKRRKELVGMALYYPPASRSAALPYEYYREVFYSPGAHSADGRANATPLLAQAEGENLSLGEFRRRLRRAARQVVGEQQAHPALRDYADLMCANRYARQQLTAIKNGEYTRERAEAVLSDISDVARFIEALKNICSSATDTSVVNL
jgi:hypothetical protein